MVDISQIKQDNKISVIMGIYNCADTLPTAINSILAQTYTNWELIMCDDASTDNTYDIALSYKEQYPDKIVLIRNEVNSKLSFTLNHCLKYATGKYVARMDGDDISLPDRFEKQINFLNENPNIDLVGTAMQRFNDKGTHDIVYGSKNPDRYTLRKKIPFCHATIMTYKSVYDKLGGYTVAERTNRAQDHDLWFKFFYNNFQGENLEEVLYLVREDENAVRRRTAKARINTYKTTLIGYKLLKFPKRWLIIPTIKLIIRLIIPYFVVDWYRAFQSITKNQL